MAMMLSTPHEQRRRYLVTSIWQDPGSKRKGRGEVDSTSRKVQREEAHGVAEWDVGRQGQPG
jgi:hypothetical protein